MNYIYNIKVNLKDELINFYEWTNTDKIIKLNKVKIYVISYYDYNNVLSMNIKVRKEFLNNIKTDNYICLFTNTIDVVCVSFNKDGIISKISKLDIYEEREVLDELSYKSKTKLLYSKINKNNNYKLITRKEEQIIEKLLSYLNDSKNNTELIDYLYYEWFHNNKSNNKYNDLITEINSEYTEKHNKLYEIIELINS